MLVDALCSATTYHYRFTAFKQYFFVATRWLSVVPSTWRHLLQRYIAEKNEMTREFGVLMATSANRYQL